MINNGIIISVIVPVFNVEQYLSDCINSIIDQTYSDFELILVDDGSTDLSGTICDEYTKKDKRIKCFHKTNGGLSDARNFGMSKAKGEYYTFIDSDDFIGKNYLSLLIDMVAKYNVKMSVIRFGEFYSEEDFVENVGDSYLVDRTTAFEYMLTRQFFGLSACGKIYHRSLFEDIKYPKGYLYEDLFTTPYVLYKCDKIAYSDSVQYFYRKRENSITHRKMSKKDYLLIDGNTKLLLFVKNNFPELLNAAIYRFDDDMISYLFHRLIYEDDYVVKINTVVRKYNMILRKGLTNKYLNKNRKIQLALLLVSPKAYKKVYLKYIKKNK